MRTATEIRNAVNGINIEQPDAAQKLKLHLAELANVCEYQGDAIRELQAMVMELQKRPEVKGKAFGA